jgi:hypothetical protein
MSEKTVETDDVKKALEALQDIAKGHDSRGTATTKVESMRDGGAGAGSSGGSTQVFHTPSNSDPGTWAGTGQRTSPEDGATDGISSDGTDYSGSAEMVKSVLEKVAKGESLNAIEKAVFDVVVKGYGKKDDDDEVEKAAKCDDDDDDDDKKENPFAKSLEDIASDNEDVAKGLEVSSFLHGWTEVQSDALKGVEGRLSKSISGIHAETQAYQQELAKSLAGLAEVLVLQSQRQDQIESTPARGPKSAVSAVEKSFGAGGAAPQGDESLNKSQVLHYLTGMVEAGTASVTDVIRFESTDGITPELEAKVLAAHSGRSN